MADEASGSDAARSPGEQGGGDVAFASAEIRSFLKTHSSSCPGCGLQLKGVKAARCPWCRWVLELETLKSREPTVLNMVSKWDWLCPGCGYNVKGINQETCPECGCPLTPRNLVPPEQAKRSVRRPKTVAVLCGVVVAWLAVLAIGAVIDARGWTGLNYLPCAAGPALGFVVAMLILAGDRARRER